jgi:DNA-3-methyladenine glycosylase II
MEEALRHFKKHDPVMHQAAKKHHRALAVRSRRVTRDRLFATLCESVVSQQLSVKASDTIWKRLEAICGGAVTSESIRATSLPRLQKAGLSKAKAKALKAIAAAVEGGLNLPALKKKSPEEASEALTNIWGVGPWTAEMFLMFGLHHPDIFSARDLGLVRAMEKLYDLKNPTHSELEAIALRWSPHRTFACRILWKSRDFD